MESGLCKMNQYYSVWADGENFRPMISQNEDDIARRLYDATSLASLEPLEFSPKGIQEDLDEEAEINPVTAEAIVKARYERGYADCIYVWPEIGPVLILSQRAVDRIETIVGNDGEYFRFDVDGTTVYLFHCTKVLNCLDVDRSEIICHSSGKRSRVEQYAFNSEIRTANVFFRIAWPDEDGRLLPELFATQRLFQVVESLGLSGFRFKILKQTE